MNENFSNIADADCSCLQVEVMVHETWIDKFLANHALVIPVGEKYHLANLKVDLVDGSLKMQADIQEKQGSSIIITCKPFWNVEQQQIQLTDLRIDTLSKNILLKSAGWFAKTFMSEMCIRDRAWISLRNICRQYSRQDYQRNFDPSDDRSSPFR